MNLLKDFEAVNEKEKLTEKIPALCTRREAREYYRNT